ncbi:DUF2269 domain-containing protein [Bacillus sp. NEB1478]|uniref:DUF2269 domain-containing protein n=1 Tax=Bacillus sp. NEB1478 TaxID=3073816 RepID=UPI002872E788|nr:DUF2269 domain-containing protein [Bacillus sp. NEB1478]WNB93893.1 DUF2269 domain-containing protein [Bacillus sp. NEB1478]
MLLLINLIVMPLVLLGLLALFTWIGKKRSVKFNPKQKNLWLIAHIFFVIIYFGGLLTTLLLAVSTKFTQSRELIYAAHLFIQYSDWFLIIPGGIGTFITGIWLAVRTHWGATKHYWVLVKWIGNVVAIVFGANFMRMWIHDHFEEIFSNPVHPLENSFYLSNLQGLFLGITFSLVLLLFLVVISYVKPWGKRNQKNKKDISI